MVGLARSTVAALLLLLLQAPAIAGETPRPTARQATTPLALEQIYGPEAVTLERAPTAKWLESGDAYTTLEADAAIVRTEAASGARSALVRASELNHDGKPLHVADYHWAPGERTLLLHVAAPGARGNNPVGDDWLFDLATRRLRRLGEGLPPGSLAYAQFSPDGARVAYVSGNDLYVEPVAGGRPVALTTDGSATLLNGRSDVVYEEEFGLGRAFAWSPDSRHIAYWQFDTAGVGTFHMIDNLSGLYSRPVPQQYPLPGTTNSAVRVGVTAVDAPSTRWLEIPGDARNHYIPRLHWADAGSVMVQQENRLQNHNRVWLGDIATGKARELMNERDAAWLMPVDELEWVDGGRAFTWISERDGWRHLYTVSRDGKRRSLRTPGAYDVVSIERIDAQAGVAWFIASPENVAQRYLYRATLTGTPKVERLTPVAASGTHDYDIAPGGRFALHTFSTASTPPVIDVVALPGHQRARVLVDNAPMQKLLAGTSPIATEFFKVDVGEGVKLDAWMMKPPGFDPAKRYPLLVYVYSEPAGQTVVDRWGGDRALWHMMLAQQGYLVASVDSRGAAAPRGRAWRKSIYRQVGILASADQAAALRRMLAEQPYIDPERVGIWGWSGGGAMTLNAMFRYPDLYAAGIAVASPADQRLYNSVYQERYMGLPADNAAGYRDGSPINFAQNLKGKLLIVHGTGDDNVHYQNSERLTDRLIALNKPFEMMAYPNRTHGISEGENTRLHLFTMATGFLRRNLPTGYAP